MAALSFTSPFSLAEAEGLGGGGALAGELAARVVPLRVQMLLFPIFVLVF